MITFDNTVVRHRRTQKGWLDREHSVWLNRENFILKFFYMQLGRIGNALVLFHVKSVRQWLSQQYTVFLNECWLGCMNILIIRCELSKVKSTFFVPTLICIAKD